MRDGKLHCRKSITPSASGSQPESGRIRELTDDCFGREAALRRSRRGGWDKRVKYALLPSPDAALGDGDSAARCPLPAPAFNSSFEISWVSGFAFQSRDLTR